MQAPSGGRTRPATRLRRRRCLLKEREQRFHHQQARQRYCRGALAGGGAEMVAVEGPAEVSMFLDVAASRKIGSGMTTTSEPYERVAAMSFMCALRITP